MTVFQIHAETTSTMLSSQMKLSRRQNALTLSKKGMKYKGGSAVFHPEVKKKYQSEAAEKKKSAVLSLQSHSLFKMEASTTFE